MQQKWQVTHVAMAHRTGTVKVCEASVIIAVSSPHRLAALEVRLVALGLRLCESGCALPAVELFGDVTLAGAVEPCQCHAM